jgi:hypothetical protein
MNPQFQVTERARIIFQERKGAGNLPMADTQEVKTTANEAPLYFIWRR